MKFLHASKREKYFLSRDSWNKRTRGAKIRDTKYISGTFGKMAGVTGLEPAASGVTGRRSNQLSYTPARYMHMYNAGYNQLLCDMNSVKRKQLKSG